MEEDVLVKERIARVRSLLAKDSFVAGFAILTLVALLIGLLPNLIDFIISKPTSWIGIPTGVSFFTKSLGGFIIDPAWLLLALAGIVSLVFCFYKKERFAFYPILIWIAWLSIKIRTLNLSGLKDVTTGGWTLGPDLDPFLFLRWAEYIVEHGSLMAHDALRYVPLGFQTSGELVLLPYLIAWFHKIAAVFGSESVAHSAVLFPVVMFGLTVIAFFFFVRKAFMHFLGDTQSSLIALIASFLLVILPALLPRTIAGIPEKESIGFLFLFLAFYFFLCSWTSSHNVKRYIHAVLAGISTAAMAMIWGGYIYILSTIGLAAFIAFLFGHFTKERVYLYAAWLVSMCILILPFTDRYTLLGFITSQTTGIAFFVLAVLIVDGISTRIKLRERFSFMQKTPQPVASFIITLLAAALLATIFLGPGFIPLKVNRVIAALVVPVTDRLGVTVAENRQPFFDEWAGSFGPSFHGMPIFFYLFFIGSIVLVYKLLYSFNKRERMLMTGAYTFFLISIVFSRFRPSHLFNGTNTASLTLYTLGFIILLGTFGYYYWRHYKESGTEAFKQIDFAIVLLCTLFFFSLVSARGAFRLIMVLVPSAAYLASYLLVVLGNKARTAEQKSTRTVLSIVAIIVIILSFHGAYTFLSVSKGTAVNYAPSEYTHQWQYAMEWVRENTPQDAVFGHWWDYGYWVQSIGQRATVLDGGNAIPYWNHLMGRHALTGGSSREAIEFLYAHNTTHFLIDSTDIGKYGAFSSIGSDEKYDRTSFIPTLPKNKQQRLETKNGIVYLYEGGFSFDADIVYESNGTILRLPAGKGGLAGITIEFSPEGRILKAPKAIAVDQKGTQHEIPLRYAYQDSLIDFGQGLNAGVAIIPSFESSSTGISQDSIGALIYLSNRTINTQLSRLYLLNTQDPYFKLVHTEEDAVVKQLRSYNISAPSMIYAGGFRGPIKIWEIDYPSGMEVNPEYVQVNYVNENLR
ncbi:hypothetical protein HYZ97_03050 [Candidatus Pacearchaeota archaeon]|nr:hypothetical protein [Candidatus Pacearchaeota archaeon]